MLLDGFLKIENERRELLRLIEEKREQRNKKSRREDREVKEKRLRGSILAEAKSISDFIAEKEERLKVLEEEMGGGFFVPNIPHESSPHAKGETENVEIRKWGAQEDEISPVESLGHRSDA